MAVSGLRCSAFIGPSSPALGRQTVNGARDLCAHPLRIGGCMLASRHISTLELRMAAPAFPPSPDRMPVRRALISVSDKTGLVETARALAALGVELVSTGG